MSEQDQVLAAELAGSDYSLSCAYLASILPPLAEHYGLSVSTLLSTVGLPDDLLLQSQGMLPLVDAVRLFLQVLAQTGDTGLGFEAGRQVRPRCPFSCADRGTRHIPRRSCPQRGHRRGGHREPSHSAARPCSNNPPNGMRRRYSARCPAENDQRAGGRDRRECGKPG